MYKDSATGITDSQYVTSDSLRMVPVYNNPTDMKHLGDAEKFDVEVFSPLEQYYYHYFFRGSILHDCIENRKIHNDPDPCNYVNLSKYHSNNFIGEIGFFSNQYKVGSSYIYGDDGSKNYYVKLNKIYDSLIINNVVYRDVYELEFKNDLFHSLWRTKFFVGRHYGTIKRTIYATQTQTQTLIRSKIKQ